MGARGLTATALAAAALGGCGPTPPQAPGPVAHRLNESLSGFSEACGHAAEIQAFSKSPHLMALTERQAAKQVPVVARIYKVNPHWVFQGKTVAQLVQMSVTLMTECGLHRAAALLKHEASG